MIFFICFASLLLILLLGFLLFILLLQRRKSNRFIRERETLKIVFNEQLLKSQLEIQEQSFNTISMEIHDNVGQTLSLLKVQLNIIDQKDVLDKTLIKEAKENVGKAMTDLRDIAKSLSTDRIQHSTLSEMTEHELLRISQTGVMRVAFQNEGEERPVKDEKKLIIFRIIQECFQNIIKHAGATSIIVFFAYLDKHLKIEITDNGIGFDTYLLLNNGSKGLGLQNIIKRAEIVGGEAQIDSTIDKGTKIIIITPYV